MFLQRLQVEEGFLDGLDVEFVEGLNVIIGARGTGKTSVIELVRYVLGANGYTSESAKRSIEHARSVLGDGKVIATLDVDGESIRVARSASDPSPQADGDFPTPIIFTQTEIESVGLDRAGRLRLLDGFVSDVRSTPRSDAPLRATIRAFTADIESKARDIATWESQLQQLAPAQAALKALASQEQQISRASAATAAKKKSLDALAEKASEITLKQDALTRFRNTLAAWQQQVDGTLPRVPSIEAWRSRAHDPLTDIRAALAEVRESSAALAEQVRSLSQRCAERAEAFAVERRDADEAIRALRREIEELQQGAGEVAKSAAIHRERIAQLEAIKPIVAQLTDERLALLRQRDALLEKLEKLRHARYEKRRIVATKLSKDIGPIVRVVVERSGQFDEYTQLITEALRGSGIRYNEVAPLIAKTISPRELLDIVEAFDSDELGRLIGISKERSVRILAQLRERSLADIAVCTVEDDVEFGLLDGTDYKPITSVSTGQRCTVVLPVVLQHGDRMLVVDQPEDHIDNAFIVGTVISSLRQRRTAQTILATHNANIPVLGEASKVLLMGSDGRRGYLVHAGPLDDEESVAAITSIMEGGREAFLKRAHFYDSKYADA